MNFLGLLLASLDFLVRKYRQVRRQRLDDDDDDDEERDWQDFSAINEQASNEGERLSFCR